MILTEFLCTSSRARRWCPRSRHGDGGKGNELDCWHICQHYWLPRYKCTSLRDWQAYISGRGIKFGLVRALAHFLKKACDADKQESSLFPLYCFFLIAREGQKSCRNHHPKHPLSLKRQGQILSMSITVAAKFSRSGLSTAVFRFFCGMTADLLSGVVVTSVMITIL